MSFGAPGFLWLLALAAIALASVALWVAWQFAARRKFGTASRGSFVAYASVMLIIASMAVAAVAAARPQVGHEETEVEQKGIDLMIVVDVSNSMFATDTQPTRLRRAQDEIAVMLERMTGDRAGLVIFAGAPFLRSPLTSDLAALQGIVAGVHDERALIPPGSDLGAAIERASVALDSGIADTKVMLVVSDGEDHGGRVSQAIQRAAASGIRVYTAGAGTEAGSPVLDFNPETQTTTPRLTPGGQPVLTRLDSEALTNMAATGNGRYVSIESGALAGLPSEFDGLASTTFASEETATPIERFQIFAAMALALAVAAIVIPAIRWPRARAAMRLWPIAGAMFIAGICATDAADENRRGNREYADGNFDVAADAYRTAQALDPERPELFHNAGNAYDEMGEYGTAIDETQRALDDGDDTDDALRAVLEYALGGHFAGATQLQDAIEAYKRSLLADPDDLDAKHNLELVMRRLTPTTSATAPATPPAPQLTPSPSDPTDAQGTPQTGGTPQPGASPNAGDDDELTPGELERELDEALAGIDDEFTVEEAIRVLQLLEEQNREQIDEGREAPGGLPDY
jgi:Ca-activated chloride channel family protein